MLHARKSSQRPNGAHVKGWKTKTSYARLAKQMVTPQQIHIPTLAARVEKSKDASTSIITSGETTNIMEARWNAYNVGRRAQPEKKTLKAKFKKSKRYCKCGNPIHSEKCPLATMFYDKRRWPGGDGYLTAEDSVFLSNLHPRPQWWAHALRKPMKTR